MVFTSFEFLIFFAAVLLLRGFVRSGKGEKWLLLVASIGFYLSWSIPCVVLILLTSFVDYGVGRRLEQTADPVRRRRWLQLSLGFNLGLLGFFKYTNFFVENVAAGLNALGLHVGHPHYNIVLPPAISYFTFASMSYVLDVYYERLAPTKSAADYSLFITFFPKVLSGPIVRAREFLPQLQTRQPLKAEDIESGLVYFLQGAVKKLVIADQVAGNVNLIFSSPSSYDAFTLLQGLLGYAVQMYCDFSGYSDMAIGTARLLGFKFPENFQMPFSAASITEYWRRWHITLSQWFRDYVFLPLEIATRDNPSALLRATINMTVTMLLCGLWHGASWTFVVWGGLHGLALAVHKAWTVWNPLARLKGRPAVMRLWAGFSQILTLVVVLLAWVFFRADSLSSALLYLKRMLTWSHQGTHLTSPYIWPAVAAVALAHLLQGKDRNWAQELPLKPLAVRLVAFSCLLGLLVFLGATDAAPFIYFQF